MVHSAAGAEALQSDPTTGLVLSVLTAPLASALRHGPILVGVAPQSSGRQIAGIFWRTIS